MQLDDARPGAGLAIGVADMSTFYPSMQNLGVGEGSWCYSKTGQSSIGGNSGFSDYGETFTHGSVVCLVLDMDAGTLRFVRDGRDQGIACCSGLRGRVLTPGVVMGTNKGGKRTRVTVVRTGASCQPSWCWCCCGSRCCGRPRWRRWLFSRLSTASVICWHVGVKRACLLRVQCSTRVQRSRCRRGCRCPSCPTSTREPLLDLQ